MKYLLPVVTAAIILSSCGGNDAQQKTEESSSSQSAQTANGNPSYDPNRGEGKFTHVEVGAALDAAKAEAGDKVYAVKCGSCHKLSDEKLVGPGWKGVTTRHSAEWIMNFITNPDEMLDKDPKAQAMLEICLVRMPNQNLTDEDARNVFEFMRKNDGVK
ncbi:MAG: cytochrome c [Sphingobacteriales bacterium]|nr:cytochrome c [Sphingobacteriales bacterium]OJY87576.1 MAG: cytochrome C [Sphingobacteriales bacterium 44-15]